MSAWIVTALAAGMPVPKPDTGGAYSGHLTGHLTVRLPRSMHRDLALAAAQDGVSLNTLIATALGRTPGASTPETQAVAEEPSAYDASES